MFPGLLANMSEFLSVACPDKDTSVTEEAEKESLESDLADRGIQLQSPLSRVGEVSHIFSHINMKYVVWRGDVTGTGPAPRLGQYQDHKWLTQEQFMEDSVSTAMKKIFQLYKVRACGLRSLAY